MVGRPTVLAVMISAALAGGVHGSVSAAGLGRLTVQSALGQPLQAQVEITSLMREELATLSARLAPPEAFRQAGIEPNAALSSLRFAIDRRQLEIFEAFPDALDLMTVCVEAGLAMDAALLRVADEIGIKSPILAEELHLVTLELRAGLAKDRPVHFQEVFATLYHNLGIDVRTATINDFSGRPQYLVDEGREPIRELV